jgi:hypothetical protein
VDEDERHKRLAARTPAEIDTRLGELQTELTSAQWGAWRAHKARAGMDEAKAKVSALQRKIAILGNEYDRRPWARYWQAGTIVHGDISCRSPLDTAEPTLMPELSGMADGQATSLMGGRQLCCTCFPGTGPG